MARRSNVGLPWTVALNEPERYAEECLSLDDWSVGVVHKIPLIWEFMNSFGGCTNSGEIFWRLEDKQVVFRLLDGWFRESTPNSINEFANMRSIVMGSPGTGKSMLLCVMAFHLVFKHKKNVFVYRRSPNSNEKSCLVYLGYHDGNIVYFTEEICTSDLAVGIYGELRSRLGVSNVWLLLDGFRYQDIPEGVRTFRMLATSQQVYLSSGEETDAYCCLSPCWSKKDLFSMGNLIHKYTTEEMEERFYYSGGSVRDFTLATPEDTWSAIDSAVKDLDDKWRHIFVKDSNEPWHFIARRYWVEVIDSEYAALALCVGVKSAVLNRTFTWATNTGIGSLAESVFEIYLHRLAVDNILALNILTEYDTNGPKQYDRKQVEFMKGQAICSGTASDYDNDLVAWRDEDKFTYWFPGCYDFPEVYSVVKLEPAPGKKNTIAYLHFTVGTKHTVDGEQLQKMNEIFYPDDVRDAGDTEPPIYIAVCSDRKSCGAFVLKPPAEGLGAGQTCRFCVGYYCDMGKFNHLRSPTLYNPQRRILA